MNNLMVDIETLGTDPNSVIISIGAAFFSRDGTILSPTFHVHVDLKNAVDSGQVIQPSTLLWWLHQSTEAQKELTCEPRYPLSHSLVRFFDFIQEGFRGETPDLTVWARGPQFDIAVLEHAARLCKLAPPWAYYMVRDTRTLLGIAGIDVNKFRTGTQHNALYDVLSEITAVHAAFTKLQL